MTSRERIRTIVSGRPADRCGLWLGEPVAETWPIYHKYFGTSTQEELRVKLHDDFRWLAAWDYVDPRGIWFFQTPTKVSNGDPGPLVGCESADQLDALYTWPEARYVHLDTILETLRASGDVYRATGLWTCFHHNVMDLLGMENYLAFMYERPEIVQAVTDRVCQFYYEANQRFFAAAGEEADALFMGNDFGTQLSLLCAPEQFERFHLPWIRRFVALGHRFSRQVIVHSCGSVHRIIDRFIDAGVNCLHPLQSLARDMDAESLASDFAGRIAFMGGIDTQNLLVNGTPGQVKAEVRRVKRVLGPCVIISPSHEGVLPNVPPENMAALAEAAVE